MSKLKKILLDATKVQVKKERRKITIDEKAAQEDVVVWNYKEVTTIIEYCERFIMTNARDPSDEELKENLVNEVLQILLEDARKAAIALERLILAMNLHGAEGGAVSALNDLKEALGMK